jgi:hypothetical protein
MLVRYKYKKVRSHRVRPLLRHWWRRPRVEKRPRTLANQYMPLMARTYLQALVDHIFRLTLSKKFFLEWVCFLHLYPYTTGLFGYKSGKTFARASRFLEATTIKIQRLAHGSGAPRFGLIWKWLTSFLLFSIKLSVFLFYFIFICVRLEHRCIGDVKPLSTIFKYVLLEIFFSHQIYFDNKSTKGG